MILNKKLNKNFPKCLVSRKKKTFSNHHNSIFHYPCGKYVIKMMDMLTYFLHLTSSPKQLSKAHLLQFSNWGLLFFRATHLVLILMIYGYTQCILFLFLGVSYSIRNVSDTDKLVLLYTRCSSTQ